MTEEQYNLLAEVEKNRLDAEKRAYEKARAQSKRSGGKSSTPQQTVSIRTKG